MQPSGSNGEELGFGAKPKLLVVDDNEQFCWAVTRSFENRGYEVKPARSTAEACALLDRFRPDYAIIDLRLPGPTGLTLIPLVKSASPGARIIIISGYASIATAVQAIKLGATQYLMKPVDAQAMEAAFHHDRPDTTVRPSDKLPSIDRMAWEYMQQVLMECNGNVSATARALRMHRKTLQRKLGRHPAPR